MTTNAAAAIERLESEMREQLAKGSLNTESTLVDRWADELATLRASLAQQQGEAFAWLVVYNGRVVGYATSDTKDEVRLAECETLVPVFTHPAAVDAARVERGARALFDASFVGGNGSGTAYTFDSCGERERDCLRNRFRTAFTAALQPANSEGEGNG